MNRDEAIEIAKILTNLIELAELKVILRNFINAFVSKTFIAGDGRTYLYGNFTIPGTVSGRMSSSKVNLQNLPSTGSKYAKIIKECFKAPSGWILCGADFSSLEDRISALTTKDPNKLKVYLEGYDGHSLRAYSYYPERLPGIVNTKKSINSIAALFPSVRQDSKGPTFCLTYGGTHYALINQCGLAPDVAFKVEASYHDMYQVSDKWVADQIQQATLDGYVTVAFGMRVRTPILNQVVLNTKSTPYAARSEARTAGNALGQSYGMLNNRACNAFMDKVRSSEFKLDILPIAQIHDASYYLVRDNVKTLKYLNDHLIPEMEWQDDPAIAHDVVKLGGELEVYPGGWHDDIAIPNGATISEIKEIASAWKRVNSSS